MIVFTFSYTINAEAGIYGKLQLTLPMPTNTAEALKIAKVECPGRVLELVDVSF